MQTLSSATPQRLNLHFAFTALESTEKRQILIVSSLRPQRKSEAITNALRERLQRLLGRRCAKGGTDDADDILRRIDALPILDERSAEEVLGYDSSELLT